MTIRVAIIGAGPAGFYTAEALTEADAEIDLIEYLPAPYGLIRAGVAPDHQTTKKIQKSYAKTALKPAVRYYGNVKVGRDVSLDELREIYDAVVLAIGAPTDNPARLPGADKRGVYGSAAFVGWYNAHPDFRNLDPDLDTSAVAVVGVGNVAVDVARVLVKTPAEMATADLPDYAAERIQAAPIQDVYMFGRRGPVDAKFTNVELREMGRLENCVPIVDPAQLPDAVEGDYEDRDLRVREKNLATLKEFSERRREEKPKGVHFVFYASPVEILGGEKVEGLRLERTRVEEGRAVGTGEFFEVACGAIVSAIGYRSTPIEGAPFDEKWGIVPNEDGRVEDGLYAVGWIKRGPTGTIATNKPDGKLAAEQILADGKEGKPGRASLEKLLAARGVRPVSFEEWQKIEAIEEANATPPSPRRKFATVEDMLAQLERAEAARETGCPGSARA
ncbi:MAG: FAD-dependent oxidoreductase [Alphaproteobacteria bacterium]|nr:FAD-dependent oxidoreductase [Alphaproteobacteria bacterium]